jgi:predicted RNA-binding Zn-ribbon protein involved in translation (DUF1610 family)
MSSMVMIRCPISNRTAGTGIFLDGENLSTLRAKHARFRCPECGQVHGMRDGYAWVARIRAPANAYSRADEHARDRAGPLTADLPSTRSPFRPSSRRGASQRAS